MRVDRKLYFIFVISSVQVTWAADSHDTPSPEDLVDQLNELSNGIDSFLYDQNQVFIQHFIARWVKATTKPERTCLAARFVTYYTDVASQLMDGFRKTEKDGIDGVIKDVKSASPDDIQELIAEVTAIKETVARHKISWPMYIAPVDSTYENMYDECLIKTTKNP